MARVSSIDEWVPYLCDPHDGTDASLEVFQFDSLADIPPFEGKNWGVLLSRARRTMFPYAGSIVLFERTLESESIFRRIEKEVAEYDSLYRQFTLPERAGAEAPSHDGLFSADQVKRYDEFLVDSAFWSALQKITFEDWEKNIPNLKSDLLLDLGCGTGRCLFHFARQGWKVIGVDLSYPMLTSIQARADSSLEHCILVLASAVRLPIRDAAVPAVTSFGTLHHVSSPPQTLKEIYRVLKTRGVVQALEPNRSPLRIVFDMAMRILPMWEEEAGEENLFTARKIRDWSGKLPIHWQFRYSIFVLPHLFAPFKSVRTTATLIRMTDRLRALPLIRMCAGLLIFKGEKR